MKHIARRIQSTGTHKLYSVEIDIALLSPTEFRSWRIEVRNVIDYRRRMSHAGARWWRQCGLHIWWGADGKLRGVLNLGAVGPQEFASTFGSRWPVTLRPVDPATLREMIYAIVQPSMIGATPSLKARYQQLKLAIWPRCEAIQRQSPTSTRVPQAYIEPMPVLI